MARYKARTMNISKWLNLQDLVSSLLGCQLHEEIPSDTEDILKLEFEPEVLPPSPRANVRSKSVYEKIEDLFELDYDFLYFDRQYEIKLKEEDESDVACF
ncbi:uncharacterized protein A4U43_C10F16030 [Asparagus officinalis]|uniref:Uncharacterized protein n=1 Tax=Asparagus officinalis TaxID=4686 RepID=A0A5P1E6H0_ASPOF|nr:uncharacterized protein A4U43_C10F16030 [Asparagus officinalis]